MKITKFIALFAVLALVFGLSQSHALALTSDSSSEASQDSVAGVASSPSTQPAQNSPAGVISSPSTQSAQDGTAGVVANTSGDLSQDSFTPTTPATPPVTTSGGGGSYYSGGSSGGGSSFLASAVSTVTPTVTLVSTTSCPLITDYLKLGGNNNPAQVTNLQIFLKNSEKFGVDVNGTFDQKTEDAVKSFQLKYLPSILGPWDATRATGFVYITTTKKINELACASPIVLSADEQAIIAAYKARGVVVEQPSETVAPANSNATGTLEVGTNDNGQAVDNTAAVGGASILSRFWNFIVNLFR